MAHTLTLMESLPEFKAALDIYQVVPLLTEVGRSGVHMVIRCPFHDDQRPSCTLYDDGAFHCFVCRESGDLIDLTRQIKGLSFSEALDWLSEKTGVERPRRSPEQEAFSAAHRQLNQALAEGRADVAELPYGLSQDQAAELLLGRTDELPELVRQMPMSLISSDEAERWNGLWLISVARHGAAGFGALIPPVIGPVLPSYEEAFELAGPIEVEPQFEISTRARGIAFAGMVAARALMRRHRTLLYTPSVAEMLSLQAGGQQGVVSAGRWPDSAMAAAMVELAPRVGLILTPARTRDERLLDVIFILQSAGLRVDIVRLQAGALRPAVSSFEFLARLTPRMDHDSAALCWRGFLDSIESPTSREIYRQHLSEMASAS